MAVGEVFLSAFLKVLFQRLMSPELLNFVRREGLEKKLEKLKKTLLTIEAVLADAEEKQLTVPAVKIWLADLRDLAYDAEDILDKFDTDASVRMLKVKRQTGTSKLRNLVPDRFSAVKFYFSMRSKINDITSRLEGISERRIQLGLANIDGGMPRSTDVTPSRFSSCLPTGPGVYGREEDKKKIIDLLLTEEPSDVNFRVLPIVGMGGLGKTTLARLVYNDEAVQKFQLKAWVCVSDDFNVLRLTKAILVSITGSSDLEDFTQVQVKLREALAGKRFLLVLDDVWSRDYGLWDHLKSPFMAGAPGSVIIVTTRDAEVARLMGPVEYYGLKHLSADDCWSVFVKHAFESRDIGARPNLESFREKIVKKCEGLPLAATALAGLLRCKLRDDEWEAVLNSKAWDLPAGENNILPVLKLSYYHLPSHLKRCFAYCAIFPKDYEFEEEEVVRLWMAEGFIQQFEGNQQMEELGGEYFRELLSRSIFQQSRLLRGGGSVFVMHGLVNDLAQWVAGETCFRLEDDLGVDNRPKVSKRARHSSYIRGIYDGIKKFEAFHEVKCLRTFLPLWGGYYFCFITNNVLPNLLPELKKLRVLSFSGYNITELPNSIGDLKHLRCLDLTMTMIRNLPESTSSLYNLQSLILSRCFRLQKLPSKMENLINLRHLDITDVYLLTEMPKGMEELKLLRTLSDFVLGKDNGSRVKELMNFKFLRRRLRISNLENVTDARDAREANLNEKQDLDVVVLKWSSQFDDSRNAEIEKDVLDMLQPHQKLKELTIKCYTGNGFPAWLGDPSFSSIELLRLEDCRKCTCLPPFGQLSSLKDLVITGMRGVKSLGPEFYGNSYSKPFPSLETLRFEDMPEWEDWNATEVNEQVERFTCLRELSIINCPKLTGKLPDRLPSLEKLVIHKCEQLAVLISSLPKLCILEIDGCEEVVHKSTVNLSSLNSMVLSKISKLTCLTEGFMRGLTKVGNLKIGGGCEELTSKALYSLTSLRELYIYKCPSLISVSKTSLLSSLYKLSVRYCSNLQTLVDDEGEDINLSSTSTSLLEYLEIYQCPSLRCLSSRGMLPVSLKHLRIEYCPELESIADTFHGNTSLESFTLWNCKNLKSLPEGLHNLRPQGGLPTTNLRDLVIHNCEKLETLPNSMHNLTSLQRLEITDCPGIISFPEEGFPTNLISLRVLLFKNCKKLEALPNGIHNLTSLQQLDINNCLGIVSFPEEGFPSNLTSLRISNMCKPLFEWGLHRLTSLKTLEINGGCPDMVSFPQEEWGLHRLTSLTRLSITDFPNLQYLSSNGFRNLSSLKCLWIYNCPKLTSFPKEGLPPSLLELYIHNCPLLKQRCKRDKGRDWSKIAHIPFVKIDDKFIYDSEDEQE